MEKKFIYSESIDYRCQKAELVIKIPEELEKEIEELAVDKSKFALEAIEERLVGLKLEKSRHSGNYCCLCLIE